MFKIKKHHTVLYTVLYVLVCPVALCLSIPIMCLTAAAAEQEFPIAGQAYVGSTYTEGGERCSSFGSLTLSGVRRASEGNAFSAEGGVTVSFRYNTHLLPGGLMDDAETVVCGRDIGASVRKGAVIIEKRATGHRDWEAVLGASDIFDSHPNGIEELYTIPFRDLFTGCSYRVTVAYRCGYKRYLQRYELNLIPMSYVGMVRDLAGTEDQAFLTHNGSTTQGFELIFLDDEEVITVSHNGKAPRSYRCEDSVFFTEAGEYRLYHRLWGRTATSTVYVLPSEEVILERLFGGVMIAESTRVFTTDEHPSYRKTVMIPFQETQYLPNITGRAHNQTTGEHVSFDTNNGTVAISGAGVWEIVVTVGETGSFYEFSATVRILDERALCSVNEWLLQGIDSPENYAFVLVPYQNEQAILARGPHGVYTILPGFPLNEQIPEGKYVIEEYSGNKLTYSYPLRYGLSETVDPTLEEGTGADPAMMPPPVTDSEPNAVPRSDSAEDESPTVFPILTVLILICSTGAVVLTFFLMKKKRESARTTQ